MNTVLILALFLVSYTLAATKVRFDEREAEAELLSREKRELSHWAENKPDEHVGCPAGKFEERVENDDGQLIGFSCTQCPTGTFTKKEGHFMNCVDCQFPNNQSTPPGYNEKCINMCEPGKGWSQEEFKCKGCPSGFVQPALGLVECYPCKRFFQAVQKVSCNMKCPRGYQPAADGSTCYHCPIGHFKSLFDNSVCQECCDGCKKNWTYYVGARRKSECIKLPDEVKTCFPYLLHALNKTVPYLFEDLYTEHPIPLLDALCLSGANLTRMREEYLKCRQYSVLLGQDSMPAVPRVRYNDTHSLDLDDVFGQGASPSCYDTTTAAGATTTSTMSSSSWSTSTTSWSTSTTSSTLSWTTSTPSTSTTSGTTTEIPTSTTTSDYDYA